MTNKEKIQTMTEDELYDLLANEPYCNTDKCDTDCEKCIHSWLREDAKC